LFREVFIRSLLEQAGPRIEARAVTSPLDGADPSLGSSDQPKPGELKIKERRSWKTWQLLTAVLIAAIAGMWINGDTGGG